MRTPTPPGISSTISLSVIALILLAAVLLARYNWRAGRADSRSAIRVGLFCAILRLVLWSLSAHHVGSSAELTLASEALRDAAFTFATNWLIYLALEPWVRRYWPQSLITWSRLLSGRWRDPMVGRDILLGSVCGCAYLLLFDLFRWISVDSADPEFSAPAIYSLLGFRSAMAQTSAYVLGLLTAGLAIFLILFLLRMLLRKDWLAALAFIPLGVFMQVGHNTFPSQTMLVANIALYCLVYGIIVWIALRLGFFALMATLFVVNTIGELFRTANFGAWDGTSSLMAILMICGFAYLGFRLSLSGRPLLETPARQ